VDLDHLVVVDLEVHLVAFVLEKVPLDLAAFELVDFPFLILLIF
jgi:hypothetical protein